MAAKLIDLSFTLNGRKVKVQIAPDTMLFSLLREQGCASVRCACETTNCGLCTVWLDGDPVLSCSVPAARVEGHTITTLEGLKAESEALARAMAAEDPWRICRSGPVWHSGPAFRACRICRSGRISGPDGDH